MTRPSAACGGGLSISRLDTSAGPMLAAFSGKGLVALERGGALETFGEALTHRFGRHSPALGSADELERQLDDYLSGGRRAFDVALDLGDLAEFDRRVLLATCGIPYGETVTYGELAASLGQPGAARAVGNALSRCPISVVIPCHRVVRASDGIGGWGANLEHKRQLLALERGGSSDQAWSPTGSGRVSRRIRRSMGADAAPSWRAP